MNPPYECIDPYAQPDAGLFIRAEHLARYLYAAEFIGRRKLRCALDAACGTGYGAVLLADRAEQVVGVERSPERVAQAREQCSLRSSSNVMFDVIDLNGGLSPFDSSSFDCVTCFETLEHVARDETLLREFHRVLRRGGWLMVSVPKADYEPTRPDGSPANPYHLRLYEPEALMGTLTDVGFSIEKAMHQPYSNAARLRIENYCRDRGIAREQAERFFDSSPEALDFLARVFAWPTTEAGQQSSTLMLVCKKK